MPSVDIMIGNRHYELACDVGEEAHLRQLAENITARFKALEKTFEHASENRLLALTCLVMEDELRQAKAVASLPAAPISAAPAPEIESARQKMLESVVVQLESLAQQVESL